MKILTLRGNESGIFDAKILKMFKSNGFEIRQWDSRKKGGNK